MVVCFFDFVLAPVLWSLVQAFYHGGVNVQWQPLTLQGAGLFHVSMGAVLGLAAWGRTQEKLNGANNGGIAVPANVGTTYTPPAPITPTVPNSGSTPPAPNNNGGTPPASNNFGGGFGSTPPGTGGFGSGFVNAPAQATISAVPPTIAVTASGKKIVPSDASAYPIQ